MHLLVGFFVLELGIESSPYLRLRERTIIDTELRTKRPSERLPQAGYLLLRRRHRRGRLVGPCSSRVCYGPPCLLPSRRRLGDPQPLDALGGSGSNAGLRRELRARRRWSARARLLLPLLLLLSLRKKRID